MPSRLRCPVCRNSGDTLDGKVVREYRPWMQDGKVVGKLSPLYREQLKCSQCGTVLLVWRNGEWVQTWGVK